MGSPDGRDLSHSPLTRRPHLDGRDRRCAIVAVARATEYLRQLYYDSMVFTPEGLRHLIAEVGASQIVMGTDYPFPWTKTAVDHILTTPG
jgi:aminocarboxymuconate-semialdehyde decarboxylase